MEPVAPHLIRLMRKTKITIIKNRIILTGGVISVLLLTIFVILRKQNLKLTEIQTEAFNYMKYNIAVITEEHQLIGPEISEITTTLGDEQAKRTSLNPLFASLLVSLLTDAGVREGDTVAVCCSGSFPGLLVAALSAAQAMNIHPSVILSLGASSFGASDPSFTILDLHMLMYEKGLTPYLPLAVSPGGDGDTGSDMEEETRHMMTEKARQYGIRTIIEENLVKNRMLRDSIHSYGKDGSIKAFINIGGGYASMGTSTLSLLIKPGLVRKAKMPPPGERGMIHDMIEKGIPVIHLLYIKGIALTHNIPWDAQ